MTCKKYDRRNRLHRAQRGVAGDAGEGAVLAKLALQRKNGYVR